MPDYIPPTLTERPDQRLSDDENDHIVYPIRQDDKADEIELLRAQLAAARAAWHAVWDNVKEHPSAAGLLAAIGKALGELK